MNLSNGFIFQKKKYRVVHDFNGRGVIEKLKVVDKYIPKKKRKKPKEKKRY